ncbi:MAG: DUF885 domain-containing protein [Verrucomicrobiota bacterium]
MNRLSFFLILVLFAGASRGGAQISPAPPPVGRPDVSNKALITKQSPAAAPTDLTRKGPAIDPAALHQLADDYYAWRNENYPVLASDMGLHTADDQLTDYSSAKVSARGQHVREVLQQVRSMRTDGWAKDDRIDWLLFRSQLEGVEFSDRVLTPGKSDPLLYIGECSNAIFSLLKKEYDTPTKRALAATARFRAMPGMLVDAKTNLQRPVKLFARLAIESARAMDPLFNQSAEGLAKDLQGQERTEFDDSRTKALEAIHAFADALEKGLPQMSEFTPMGEANYNYYLTHVLLLPLNSGQVEMLGRVELARYRALEALLPDPTMANPDPARAKNIPPDQESFLRSYESREQEMVGFLQSHHLITLPEYLGPFQIRQLPEAFKPTSPGGFMNPPGLYDKDPAGFYFIPTYNPQSKNFYIRAAIEDPRPILGHEGIPGHFLQISIANHLKDEIRRQNENGPFVEGWALYGEEMLMRTGLYPDGSAAQGQILRLSRYRAARVGVDVNLHTGKWTFEQAVQYFMDAGGLDREAAEGEAAGAATAPTQKIWYITGKWQIMNLLGKYHDKVGANFNLGGFHDDLIKNGSLPLSIVEWLLLDDSSTIDSILPNMAESN